MMTLVNVLSFASCKCPSINFTALVSSEDTSLQFILQTPMDAITAVEVAPNQFLLVFSSKKFSRVLLDNKECYTQR